MVTSFFSAVTDYIGAHPHLAYAVVFLLALSESIPVIGVVVPGSAVILAVGALVPSGVVTLWPLLAASMAGAIVGDGLSFWIGHRYQRELLGLWPLDRYPELIARSEAFFSRHGDKSVFLARFTPGVRAFVPLLAGMLRMPAWRFYAANILSALVWAPSHILPGMLVGTSIGLLGAAAKPLAIMAVLLIILLWAVIHVVRFTLHRGIPVLTTGAVNLQAWSSTGDTRLKRSVFNLLDPSRPQLRRIAALALLLVGAAWLFLGVLEDVVSGDPLVRVDMSIYHALQELRTAPGDRAMIAVTELGDTFVVTAVTLVVFLWLAWRRAWRTAGYWLLAVAGASALNTAIKVALHRPRPSELLYSGWSAFAFPSGHSTVNLVLYGFLAFLIGRELSPAWRLPVAFGAAALILLIAFSRLYLGAHWFSDVVGGLAFGTVWLAAVGLSYLRGRQEPVGPAGLLVVGCAALAFAGGFNISRSHALDVQRYAVKASTPIMAADEWWTSGWRDLPDRRVDLTGELQEPLTVQWAGGLAELEALLADKGWQTPVSWTSLSALGWLTTTASPARLPVLPSFESGQLPSLTLIRQRENPSSESRFVLRLWSVDLKLTDGDASPVWVGSVIEERLDRLLSLFTLASTQPDMNAPREMLAQALPDGRLAPRTDASAIAGWDRRVLLIRQWH
ncbi:VTT domain-containing protein [Mesorhizobium sp. BAC0120]|uniref:bifunctional DedA family/phosphatase PAP2 family protein n=1 Tax=Mesorhizobium sp. BAC0120 TaxID=3090670 RepID=UPI00298CB652|nr:VTT domain-containing protein [Mesorhizobium sp. BAC0120]MDW6022537.1 VTT domain-containing protein [Mesorhizobium sp. BAC0120]